MTLSFRAGAVQTAFCLLLLALALLAESRTGLDILVQRQWYDAVRGTWLIDAAAHNAWRRLFYDGMKRGVAAVGVLSVLLFVAGLIFRRRAWVRAGLLLSLSCAATPLLVASLKAVTGILLSPAACAVRRRCSLQASFFGLRTGFRGPLFSRRTCFRRLCPHHALFLLFLPPGKGGGACGRSCSRLDHGPLSDDARRAFSFPHGGEHAACLADEHPAGAAGRGRAAALSGAEEGHDILPLKGRSRAVILNDTVRMPLCPARASTGTASGDSR